MYGLDKKSKTKEIIEKKNDHAIKYKVVEETIDLEALREEKKSLEQMLAEEEPTDEELLNVGKANHPYFTDKDYFQKRLEEINEVLG